MALTLGRLALALEMALPWTAIAAAPPAPGTVLRVLLARNRMAGETPELNLWPFASGGNHQPKLFGRAVLGGPAEEKPSPADGREKCPEDCVRK